MAVRSLREANVPVELHGGAELPKARSLRITSAVATLGGSCSGNSTMLGGETAELDETDKLCS